MTAFRFDYSSNSPLKRRQQGSAGMGGAAARRPGMALLVTLLGVIVLEVVVAGAFHLAMQQQRIAAAHVRGVQLEAAARAALAAGLAAWPELGTDSLPLHVAAPVTAAALERNGMVSAGSLRRVQPSLFVLRAEARHPATGERRAVAAVLRQLTEAEFLGSITAAVTAAGHVGAAGGVDGSAPASCTVPPGSQATVSAFALADTSGASAGAHLLPPDSVLPYHRIAGLDLSGAEGRPPGFLVTTGDTTLHGSTGPAVLVVNGDATLAPGAEFTGLLLVGGTLRISPGAVVNGAVRVGGRLELLPGGAVRWDPCVLGELFHSLSELRGPLRAHGHWWIPAA